MSAGWHTDWEEASARLHAFALFGTPCAAMALLWITPPADLPAEAWRVAVVTLWMALWWMTEAVPLAVTALLPLILFPMVGVRSIEDTAASYAHPLIFLFLGGFMLARAMERWGLHRRLAVQVARAGGARPDHVIASLMGATAFLSLWISNTATAMVMLPIGQSLVISSRESHGAAAQAHDDFAPALMLGIGYAATIGGMGSLIGTPPNALLAGFMKTTYGIEIGFAQWMLIGLPVVLILLPVTWWLLTRISFRISDGRHLDRLTGSLGQTQPMSVAEKRVATVMISVALLWIFRPLVDRLFPAVALSDPAIAIIGAMLLFVVPAGMAKRESLLTWNDVATIRWDILILFGGGLALAAGIASSGLAERIGNASAAWDHLPPLLLLTGATVVIVYLGELASNTAMAAVFLPVAGAMAVGMGAAPISLALPITLAASLGFMLPVATPPNAIVFGSGAVTVKQMLRAGAILDVIGILVVLAIGTLLGPIVFSTDG